MQPHNQLAEFDCEVALLLLLGTSNTNVICSYKDDLQIRFNKNTSTCTTACEFGKWF